MLAAHANKMNYTKEDKFKTVKIKGKNYLITNVTKKLVTVREFKKKTKGNLVNLKMGAYYTFLNE